MSAYMREYGPVTVAEIRWRRVDDEKGIKKGYLNRLEGKRNT